MGGSSDVLPEDSNLRSSYLRSPLFPVSSLAIHHRIFVRSILSCIHSCTLPFRIILIFAHCQVIFLLIITSCYIITIFKILHLSSLILSFYFTCNIYNFTLHCNYNN